MRSSSWNYNVYDKLPWPCMRQGFIVLEQIALNFFITGMLRKNRGLKVVLDLLYEGTEKVKDYLKD